jgi:hypothetical protein
MRKFLLAFAICGGVLIYSSCTKDKAEPKSTVDCTTLDSVTYTNNVRDIVDGYCADAAGCHYGSTPSEGLNLDNYQSLKDACDNNTVICRIQYGSDCGKGMPESGKMADSLINTIICWQQNGYPQ